MSAKSIDAVLIAKGIGISLVVMGHYFPENSPDYWIQIRNIIYSFHMPLFFMLSGYLYGLSHPTLSNYSQFLKKKAKRLLVPFISLSVLLLFVKLLSGLFVKLENPVTPIGLLFIFVHPLESYIPLLWFIYTLFFIFAIFPIIYMLVKCNLLLLVGVVTSLYFIPWTNYFCLLEVFRNMPIFTIGFIVGIANIDMDKVDKKYSLAIVILSLILFITIYLIKPMVIDYKLLYVARILVLGIAGSIMCIGISSIICLSNNGIVRLCNIVGLYSMTIYLLHTVFSGVVRIGFYQILKLSNSQFLYGAITGIIAGIVIPIFIEKYVLRQYSFTKRALLGIV